MPLDFPTSPAVNEIYTYGGRSWQWNGTAWDVYNAASTNVVTSFNGLTGAVTGVTTGTANTFVQLQSFSSGISANNLQVFGGVTFGPYSYELGEEFAPNTSTNPVTIDSAKVQIGDINTIVNGLKFILDNTDPANLDASLYGNLSIENTPGGGNYVYVNNILTDWIRPRTGTNIKIGNTTSLNIIGDDGDGNSTNISVRDSTQTLDLINANGTINIGDVNGVGNNTKIAVNDATNTITLSGIVNASYAEVTSGTTLTGNVYITGLGTPSVDSQAANKAYVDSVASVGIHYHTAVALASTDSETFNTGVTYNNGASGIGATLRKTASFARINIDSTDGSTGDRILIRSAATQQWNGIYSVTNQGSGSTGWILTRTTDADNYHPYENDGLGGNDYFFVTGGSSLKNNAYICSNVGGITFGTTAITFAIFSTPPVYTAGTGLALNSLQFSNTGVLSIDGGTGAITNVARTNVSNIFTANQLISAPFTKLSIVNTVLGVTSEYSASNITHYSGTNTQTISFNPTNPTNTITFPNVSTTLAGLAAGQTFTQVNTFNALTNFPGGISAAGATFSGLARFTAGISASGITLGGDIVLPNNELIRNTVNGRIDFIPLPSGTTNFGTYIDGVTSTVGVRIGTIRSSDNTLNAGPIQFDPLVSFASGLSAAGATFAAQVRFLSGITVSGGATFATDVSVNSMRLGLGPGNCGSNLAFGTNAYNAGAGGTGQNNLAIGLNALAANISGDVNVGIGRNALALNTNGRNNTAIGAFALANVNGVTWSSGFGEYNVAIGGSALFNTTTASYNMAVGSSALSNNTTGSENVAIGTFALIRNNTGNDNVAIGHQALGPGFGTPNALTENIAIGWNSLFNTNTTSRNVAIGPEVGFSNTTGASNTLIGRRALYNGVTGSNTVAIGAQAAEFAGTTTATLTNSNGSIFIGQSSRSANQTSTNEIVIGNNAVGLGNNTTVIGATTATSATVYGTINAPSGISSAGATLSQNVNILGGFTAGASAGSCAMSFSPLSSANNGGLWIRNGNLQLAGSAFSSGSGAFTYSPNSEVFNVYGQQYINQSFNYQAARVPLRLNAAPTQSVPIFAVYKQTVEGTALTSSYSATNMVAGIDNNGALFSSIGVSAAGGITLSGNVAMTSTSSHTGLASFAGGISASGATFWGNISAYNLAGGNPGVTTAVGTYTFPDGVTSYQVKTQYYQSTFAVGRDTTGFTVRANRTYFSLFYTNVPRTIQSIRMQTHTTGSTGSAFFGIYDINPTTGFPRNLLWSSASTTVAGNFSVTTVSSVNYTVSPGWFYLGVCCSLTPSLYGYNKGDLMPLFGSAASNDGYLNLYSVADTSGFTLPTSLPSAGVTFAFIDYVPANYSGVRLEYGI